MLHFLFCIFSLLFVLGTAAPGDLKQIPTLNGDIQGVESITKNNNTFFAFLGIRYGQAPIGNYRFRAPLPTSNWSGVYNSTVPGNQCVQASSNNSQNIFGNEDCLFVNVYTTQLPNETSEQLPVVVWIHGGGFIYGSGDIGLHGADRFLDHDVLLVSINYRLGIFGFLSTEDNIVPGNYGIKDQVLALQWVKKNIASFGGDPNKVTIFGQSAGSASVNYLRQSKRAQGLFRGVIADSGSTLNPWSTSRNARLRAFKVGFVNGIITPDSRTLVERLRGVDAVRLQQTSCQQTILQLTDVMNGLSYAPVLEEESAEAVYTEFSYTAQEEGDFNFGPLLHGFNSLEGRVFTDLPWYQNLFFEQYNLFPSTLTPLDMNASKEGRQTVGQNIRSYYFKNQSVTIGNNFAYYFSDSQFVRGIVKSSELQHQYAKIYLYRFSFTGGVVHENSSVEGVAHAEELQFLFEAPNFAQVTPKSQLTVERMVEMWSNFVKTGNPTPSLSDAVNVQWPLVNATGDSDIHYLDIGDDLVPAVNPEEEQMSFWDNQYSTFGYPPYNTY